MFDLAAEAHRMVQGLARWVKVNSEVECLALQDEGHCCSTKEYGCAFGFCMHVCDLCPDAWELLQCCYLSSSA